MNLQLVFMPYRDTQCGAKIFKRKAIEEVVSELGMSQWAFDLELIYVLRKRSYRIKEAPTVWSDREYSKINLIAAGPFMALAIIRLRILNSPFRNFIKLYDKMIGFSRY